MKNEDHDLALQAKAELGLTDEQLKVGEVGSGWHKAGGIRQKMPNYFSVDIIAQNTEFFNKLKDLRTAIAAPST